jgi:propanol-preferring alcohol dehydrogenase
MVGNHRDGGYAEQVRVPARALVALPDEISFAHGAVMMCSSATVYHALRRTRLAPGERVAVFGLGGLGASAVQLAFALGASAVYAVDINPVKTTLAEQRGAVGVDASANDPVDLIRRATGGVDVALELVGLRTTFEQAVAVLGPGGRVGVVGLADGPATVEPYRDIVGREMEIVGVMDHLAGELPEVLELARTGVLDLGPVVTGTIPLDAAAVNAALDDLEAFGDSVRTVIIPGTAG